MSYAKKEILFENGAFNFETLEIKFITYFFLYFKGHFDPYFQFHNLKHGIFFSVSLLHNLLH
jgi:hypothetical protein